MRRIVLSQSDGQKSAINRRPLWNKLSRFILLASVLAAIVIVPSAIADVRVLEIKPTTSAPGTQVIQIYGLIAQKDLQAFEKLLPVVTNFGISLNSLGGDVATAMAIGRILRKEGRIAVIRPDDVCVSACVLVLAGAVSRIISGGKVGIHRPYVGQDSATTAEQQKTQYVVIEKAIRSYLSEMNIDSRLYDDMFRISPTKVKYLTSSELRAYGLEGTDPYREQAYYASYAKDLGISTQELLRREAEVQAKCKNAKVNFGKCSVAILIGISDKEYARREVVAETACAGKASKAENARCYDRIIRGANE